MSYILDALRKSDQLRRRNAAPTLLPELAAAAVRKPPPLLAYGLLALVLLGAGIGIGWLRPWQPQPSAPATVADAVKPSAPRPQAEPAPQPEYRAQNPAPAAPVAPAPAVAARPAQAQDAAAAIEARSAPRTEPVKAPGPATPAASASAPPPVPDIAARSIPVGAAAAGDAVMAMAELPLAIQQELPAMSISVHAYSAKAADRLVGINGRLLHEGDSVAPGLALERITPEGMVLSYKGYTFRRGVR